MTSKSKYGMETWKQWISEKIKLQDEENCLSCKRCPLFKEDVLAYESHEELKCCLDVFVREVREPNGKKFWGACIYHCCLEIQKYLYDNGYKDDIFSDPYCDFVESLHGKLCLHASFFTSENVPAWIEEEELWDAKQFGNHSPYSLLNTVMYFNKKYLNLVTPNEHMLLSFDKMLLMDKETTDRPDKHKILRFYPRGRKCMDVECKHITSECVDGPQIPFTENRYIEIESTDENPSRCFVHLINLYISKCPDSSKNSNGKLYLHPQKSCIPDNSVFYTDQPLDRDVICIMLQRMKLIRYQPRCMK